MYRWVHERCLLIQCKWLLLTEYHCNIMAVCYRLAYTGYIPFLISFKISENIYCNELRYDKTNYLTLFVWSVSILEINFINSHRMLLHHPWLFWEQSTWNSGCRRGIHWGIIKISKTLLKRLLQLGFQFYVMSTYGFMITPPCTYNCDVYT